MFSRRVSTIEITDSVTAKFIVCHICIVISVNWTWWAKLLVDIRKKKKEKKTRGLGLSNDDIDVSLQ